MFFMHVNLINFMLVSRVFPSLVYSWLINFHRIINDNLITPLFIINVFKYVASRFSSLRLSKIIRFIPLVLIYDNDLIVLLPYVGSTQKTRVRDKQQQQTRADILASTHLTNYLF